LLLPGMDVVSVTGDGESGLEKLGCPPLELDGLDCEGVGCEVGAGAVAATGDMILPIFASFVLRVEFDDVRPWLVCGLDVFLIIVADLERLPEMKLPSKEERSTIGSPSSDIAWSGDSARLFGLEAGESPSGFSTISVDAFEDG